MSNPLSGTTPAQILPRPTQHAAKGYSFGGSADKTTVRCSGANGSGISALTRWLGGSMSPIRGDFGPKFRRHVRLRFLVIFFEK